MVLGDRANKNHEKNTVEMFTNSKPNDLLLSITTGTKTGYFSGNSGEVGTFYFDGSSLADGEYQTQADVEKILVNKYFKDAEQFSLFNDESKMINISYELQNKKIGYRLTTEDLSE